MRNLRWLDLQLFQAGRKSYIGLEHYNISLHVKVAVKLNTLEDLKHSAVALLGVLQDILDMICMYHNRGKLINVYTRNDILLFIKFTITGPLL